MRKKRSFLSALGVSLAVALAVGGLFVVGAFVLLAVGMNNYGSNK